MTSPENAKASERRRKELEEHALLQKKSIEQLIDNTALFRKTQLLFQNRRKAREARKKNKEASSSTLISPKITSVPWVGSIHDRISKNIATPDSGWLYRPPTQPRSASPVRSSGSLFEHRSVRKTITKVRNKSQVRETHRQTSSWPPPKDSNYSTVSSSVLKAPDSSHLQADTEPDSPNLTSSEEIPKAKTLKFIVCNLCGTQVSGPQQLYIHQNGRKCKNRQLKSKWPCKYCKCTFDTKHNLEDHKC